MRPATFRAQGPDLAGAECKTAKCPHHVIRFDQTPQDSQQTAVAEIKLDVSSSSNRPVVKTEIRYVGDGEPGPLPVTLTAQALEDFQVAPVSLKAPIFSDPEPVDDPAKTAEDPPKDLPKKPEVPSLPEPTLDRPSVLPNPAGLEKPPMDEAAYPVLVSPQCHRNILCSPNQRMGKHPRPLPSELSKVTMPDYVIEPPDILIVESPKSLPDQPIAGEHLVRPDGTISLGLYGSVRVAGLTLTQAREAVVDHLMSYFQQRPQINMDVYAYNSKVYYVIADGAGYGEQVVRLPHMGNETVLDAISYIGGLPAASSKKRIWVARPVAPGSACNMILPVDWNAIVQCGQTQTNYQLFPGDRLYVHSDRLVALDGVVAKISNPINRVFGSAMLAAFTVFQYKNMGRFLGGGFVAF